jgi:hypothetical protein
MSFSSFRLSALALCAALPLLAQQPATGRIVGRVLDAETGRGVPDAGIQVVGTTLGTSTSVDGQFSIRAIPAGTVTLQVRRLGYQPKTITGLQLDGNAVLEQTIALTPAVARVAAQIVTASAERGSVESALDVQRTATQIVSAVTAEQINRSPDANAAQAVQRVSGVSVQDGKYVLVRGLGERYTTTSLNGSRIPSPEPERKVVPLDLFPSGLIQSVSTSKTFTPDLPGDFTGAHVDIKTREFPAERQVTYGFSIGSAQGAWRKRIAFAPGVGGEAFAIASSARRIPGPALAAGDLSGVTQVQKNQIINSFRDVWRAGVREARPNMSARLSVGGNDAVFGRRIGYLLSGTYSYSQDIKESAVRALALPSGANAQTEYNRFSGENSGESVLLGGLMNLSTLIGQHSRLTVNGMYNRSADNDARVERGVYEDLALPMEIQRLSYVERSVWSSQLAGEHEHGRHALDWSVTGAGTTRDQPDRSELVYELATAPDGSERELWLNTLGEAAVRTFSQLDEKSIEGRGAYRLELGSLERRVSIKLGGLGRGTTRTADTRAFGIYAPQMGDSTRALPPEELFGSRFTAPDSSVLTIRSLAQGGSYTANDAIYAGFGMFEVPITGMLRLIGGARVEHSDAVVRATSTVGDRSRSNLLFTDVLPSLAITIRPTDAQAVRLSASRTLARPEYREIAGIRTRDVLGGVDVRGNPNLVRTLIDNLDVRYEFYPRRGEVLSVGAFAKRFHDPIERVSTASSTNSLVTFVNAEAADNYGLELEARKNLDVLGEWLAPVTAFSSLTLMRSEINLGRSAAASTNSNRAMVGQAPYVINAGLTYSSPDGRGSATALYNRVGTRISEAGEQPLPDVQELARDVLDVALRWPVSRALVARIDGKNLLDAPHVLRQGSVTREAYRLGRGIQVGMTLQH